MNKKQNTKQNVKKTTEKLIIPKVSKDKRIQLDEDKKPKDKGK